MRTSSLRFFKTFLFSVAIVTLIPNYTSMYSGYKVLKDYMTNFTEDGRENIYSRIGKYYVSAEDKKQIDCLAKNIYFEARNQSELGQIAVAHVTLNRVDHDKFPNNICKVVFQPYQFSWTIGKGKHMVPKDKYAWEKAKRIATLVYKFRGDDPTEGSTFYHTYAINPSWNRKMELAVVIGDHKFFFWNGIW